MTLGNDNGTDGQTDRRTDRVRRNMRPPPREEGRIIILYTVITDNRLQKWPLSHKQQLLTYKCIHEQSEQ